jgi:hypothetical protein
METLDRRTLLRRGLVAGGGLAALGPLHALGAQVAHGATAKRTAGYGPLVDRGDLWLPAGFEYSVVQRQGEPMSDGNPVPGIFDGMAAHRGKGGTVVLIRNHENRRQAGEIPVIVPDELRYDPDPTYNAGNTKVVLDRVGAKGNFEVLETFAILSGTDTNCAGGTTPWSSWITCEEVVNRSAAGVKHGYVFDIPSGAGGPVKAEPILGAGRFVHEASLFYRRRALPDGGPDQVGKQPGRRGLLPLPAESALRPEAPAREDDGRPPGAEAPRRAARRHGRGPRTARAAARRVGDDRAAGPRRRHRQRPARHAEPGPGEGRRGLQPRRGHVGGRQEGLLRRHERRRGRPGQVWKYDPERETVTLVYESPGSAVLQSPDNVVVVPKTGHIFLQEDGGGEQFTRGVTPRGEIYDFARTT